MTKLESDKRAGPDGLAQFERDILTYITKCCGFRFIGKNHSPEHNGICRNCGKPYEGEL